MSACYDDCFEAIQALAGWYKEHQRDRNEATTRVDLIDRLLFDCLGWSREDAEEEAPHGETFADYVLSAPRRILILEAKREGLSFEIPAEKDRIVYSIPGLCAGNAELKKALDQVGGYCRERGIEFGAVSNGIQFVVFIATRTDMSPMKGKALVFPSLDFMVSHFVNFWDALSKPAIANGRIRASLGAEAVPDVPAKLSARLSNYPGVKARNPFQTDLQIMSELVLEDLSRSPNLEELFLKECYCESGALSQYALTSKEILTTRYSAMFDNSKSAPTAVPVRDKHSINPELLAKSLSNRPILLIGDVGAGKSMFTRHLIKIEAASVISKAVSFYIDLGSQATLTSDLKLFIIDELIRQLRAEYKIDVYERNFVRGTYSLDLKDFGKGIYSDYRTTNPTVYISKELEFLENLISNKEMHLKRSLDHISKGRNQQIIFFLDNCDQRDEGTQQAAFLIAQELASQWPAMVFIALRPETFYYSQRHGTLSGYHAKAFTIAPPRVDKVLSKRLAFALKITSGAIPLSIFNEKQVGMKLAKLDEILRIFIASLQDNHKLVDLVDNLSGGNVRLALDLVRNFFGSGHVNTEKMLEISSREGSYTVPVHEFLRAVIFGDSNYFDPERSIVANLFDVSRPDLREHFLLPLLVALTESAGLKAGTDGFVEHHVIYEALQGIGFLPSQIDQGMFRALSKKLIEGAGRSHLSGDQPLPKAFRVTTSGLYHVKHLCSDFVYLDAVCVDTPLLNDTTRTLLKDVQNIAARIDRAELFVKYLDESWKFAKIQTTLFDWNEHSASFRNEVVRIRQRLNQQGNAH